VWTRDNAPQRHRVHTVWPTAIATVATATPAGTA
jgi:hypothetical protein